ncbi:MAG: Neutral/alkaline non-lysosomal ceramidase, N-terminal, partial [Candidatus Hydrogenedentota bacterium]
MKWFVRALLGLLAIFALGAGSVVFLVGPWPLYRDADFERTGYYRRALDSIDRGAAEAGLGRKEGRLRAGWAERDVTPAAGHPMAGYGGRANDKRAEGVKEPVFIRALALHDGVDTVVLLGSDLLQTLPNLLDLVEPRIQ